MLEHYRLHDDLNKGKLFQCTPPPALDDSGLSPLPKNWLQAFNILCYGAKARRAPYYNPFEEHLSGLSPQSELSRTVQLIYRRLNGDFDAQLGKLQQDDQAAIICKLTEEIDHTCILGFINRVNNVLFDLQKPQFMDHLLYQGRRYLVNVKVAQNIHLGSQGVHTWNYITHVAADEGLGTQPNFINDSYIGCGWKRHSSIENALQQVFEDDFTPFTIPDLIVQQLRGMFVEVGYNGLRAVNSDGYVVSETEQMTKLLKRFLLHQDVDDNNACTWNKYFILASEDENENPLILDINWKLVRQYVFEALIEQGYFLKRPQCRDLPDYAKYYDLYPDNSDQCTLEAGFIAVFFGEKNYPKLFQKLFYIKNDVPDYWKKLVENELFLKHCKQLVKNKLFLEKVTALVHNFFEKPKKDREALLAFFVEIPDLCCKETIQIILQLFLQQDPNGWNAFMLAVDQQPALAEKMFLLFTRNKNLFSHAAILQLFLQKNSNGCNILMFAVHHHPPLAEQMFQLFIRNKNLFSHAAILQLFLQQNSNDWNVFMLAVRQQPALAEQMFQLFTENPDLLSHAEILQLFLQQDSNGWNAFMLAVRHHPPLAEQMFQLVIRNKNLFSHAEILQLFLQKNSNGWNILMFAVRYQPDLAEQMFQLFTENPNLLSHAEILQLFLQQESNGWNAFMLAVRHHPPLAEKMFQLFTENPNLLSHAEILQLFLQQDSNGWNAFMLAVDQQPALAEQMFQLVIRNKNLFSHAEILQLFLQKNSNGWNILMFAVRYQPDLAEQMFQLFTENPNLLSHAEILQLFLQQESNGWNAFMLAVRHHPPLAEKMFQLFTENPNLLSHAEILQLFLQQDSNGWNAFMLAVDQQPALAEQMFQLVIRNKNLFSHAEILQLFLQKNSNGWNILMFAVRYQPDLAEQMFQLFTENPNLLSHAEILQLFLQKNSNGKNVLSVAQQIPQMERTIFNFLAFDCNRHSLSVTSKEKEIAKFLFTQFGKLTFNEQEERDLRCNMSHNTASLLLSTFDTCCFQTPECLAKTISILLEYYLKEFSARADQEITHSTYFFKWPIRYLIGYSAREKMEAAQVLKATLSQNYSREDVLALQKQHPALRNGRLGTLCNARLRIAPSTTQHAHTIDDMDMDMNIASAFSFRIM